MKKIGVILILFTVIACVPKKYKVSEKSYKKQFKIFQEMIANNDTIGNTKEWINTVNFNLRKPNFVIIHHTAQDSCQHTIKTFTIQKTQVSSHYVIGDDGKVIQMLNDYLRAWHAGNGSWGKNTDINSTSIGIELDNNGSEPFSDAQIDNLIVLLKRLKKTYNIPAQNFIGHGDIAPSRKNDPSVLFPWKKLAENGFGIYPDENIACSPENFDAIMGLRIIGYHTSDLPNAILAFKRHFMPTQMNNVLDSDTKDVIYNVFLKM
jgi:N-acetylmuramoyl-L-alanine amidase